MAKEGEGKGKGKGSMTVEEAGRLGGEKVKAERGEEFYSEIGHKGGQRVKELIAEGKEAEQAAGKKKE
jgi:general stress protein YciG